MFPHSLLSLRKGDKISCKYPKHGRRNILKRHTGTVEKVSSGANGLYATVRAETIHMSRYVGGWSLADE